MSEASSPAKRRAHGIDLLRLIAAVQMISGHTVDALIATEFRSGATWAAWTMMRGLTAPAFLFASGVSFAMVAAQNPERRGPRIKRALQLIAISYALHPPFAGGSLREFFAVDVLACIGVTLLTLELLAAQWKGRAFTIASGLAGVLAIVVAPLTASIDASGVGAPAFDYVTKSGGSLFPLLPFSGFALLGACIGSIARPRELGLRPAAVLSISAFVVVMAAVAWLASTTTPPPDVYYAWPAASLLRLGGVLALAVALTLATVRVAALPNWMTTLAGETLFLYVAHLLALYVGGIGLEGFFGASLSLGASAAVAACSIVACSAGALAWHRIFTRRR